MGVAWLEWGEEAFRRAQAEDKPVLLALTSPWSGICQTMDRDTWGDAEVVRMASADYVPVRVDADRRPDVNDRYSCGALPSTVFLTPTGDLLWGATFIPPHDMRITLARLKDGFAANRAKLAEAIKERDTRVTRAQLGQYDSRPEMSGEIMRRTLSGLLATYDPLFGGFGKPPKFPLAPSLSVLVQAFHESGGPEFQGALAKTLDAIGERGLFDGAEGGFFLCSRNEHWTQPETEKLLAEQTPLIRAYLDAGLALSEPRYLEKARRTLEYVRRTLCDEERGVFFAGQPADVEYYARDGEGRKGRTAPPVSRSVYTDGTAGMASAFLRAAAVFGEEAWAAVALRGLRHLLTEGREERGGLAHTLDGGPRATGLLRDQAAAAALCIDAYEYSADERYREEAGRLLTFAMSAFWDGRDGGLLDRVPSWEPLGELRLRRRRIVENASVAHSLVRVGRHDEARRILTSFPDFREDYGHHTAEYALAVDALVRPALTITLKFESSAAGYPAMRTAALRPVAARRVVRHERSEEGRAVVSKGESVVGEYSTPEALEAALKDV